MNLQQYIEPKLLILISVMIIGNGLKKSKYKYIPLLLGVISVVLAALWLFTANDIKGISQKKQNPKKLFKPDIDRSTEEWFGRLELRNMVLRTLPYL